MGLSEESAGMTGSHSDSFNFLHLPGELRMMVYAALATPITTDKFKVNEEAKGRSNILRTCRVIYYEAFRTLRQECRFPQARYPLLDSLILLWPQYDHEWASSKRWNLENADPVPRHIADFVKKLTLPPISVAESDLSQCVSYTHEDLIRASIPDSDALDILHCCRNLDTAILTHVHPRPVDFSDVSPDFVDFVGAIQFHPSLRTINLRILYPGSCTFMDELEDFTKFAHRDHGWQVTRDMVLDRSIKRGCLRSATQPNMNGQQCKELVGPDYERHFALVRKE